MTHLALKTVRHLKEETIFFCKTLPAHYWSLQGIVLQKLLTIQYIKQYK